MFKERREKKELRTKQKKEKEKVESANTSPFIGGRRPLERNKKKGEINALFCGSI